MATGVDVVSAVCYSVICNIDLKDRQHFVRPVLEDCLAAATTSINEKDLVGQKYFTGALHDAAICVML